MHNNRKFNGHTIKEWSFYIGHEVKDAAFRKAYPDEFEILLQVLAAGLQARPDLAAKLIGTTVIQDDFFVDVDEQEERDCLTPGPADYAPVARRRSRSTVATRP